MKSLIPFVRANPGKSGIIEAATIISKLSPMLIIINSNDAIAMKVEHTKLDIKRFISKSLSFIPITVLTRDITIAQAKSLNINDLANAVKIMVIPGEEMKLSIIKEGKESNQGLAYLDDGTMIVVENGKKYVGENIDVVVKTVLQTSAGRIIFARVK